MSRRYTKFDLIAFERRVAEAFNAKKCKGPVHLSGGNEEQLLEIFKDINRGDWVFSTYRSHYHALLHGIPEEWVWNEILEGRSMNLTNEAHRFYCSAIVGGMLPIAVGVAAGIARNKGLDRVWCFVGDMAATTGAFHEATQYASANDLPISFIVEDNDLSCDSPTVETWGNGNWCSAYIRNYWYERKWPHSGAGKYVF